MRVLEKYEDIMNIILPTLRDERRKTYCPFLPICPKTEKVLEIPLIEMNKKNSVLALKYRPSNFEDLVGQDIVAHTISNSIKSNKIPNAYLLTGIRGIGKTTTARIVAKALNCLNSPDKLCDDDQCDNCKSI